MDEGMKIACDRIRAFCKAVELLRNRFGDDIFTTTEAERAEDRRRRYAWLEKRRRVLIENGLA